MADNDRETYIAWLREEVKKHCNSEGRYEAYWDYRDSITPDQIASAVENFEKEGYASPLSYLETKLLDDMGSDLEDVFYVEGLLTDLRSAGDEVNRGWDNAQSIWDDLDSVGYKGIELNLDQLLGQSEFHVNVFFATEKEQDADEAARVASYFTEVSKPGSGVDEIIAIRTGQHRDKARSDEGRVTLKGESEQMRESSAKLAEGRVASDPSREDPSIV